MSLIAWYPLNGDIADHSGNNNHATNFGATINASGKTGSCYNFDGNSDYITASNCLNQGSDFSLSFWVNRNDTATQCLFCCRTAIGEGVSVFTLSGQLRFDTDASSQWSTGYIIPINSWVHITLIKDSNYKKLFINGVLVASTTVIGNMSTLSSIMSVGASHANGGSWGNFYSGLMNDVRIYDHALSEKEIKEIAKAKILHYTFDDFQEPTTNVTVDPVFKNSSIPTNSAGGQFGDWYFGTWTADIHERIQSELNNTLYALKITGAATIGNNDLWNIGWRDFVPANTVHTISFYAKGEGTISIKSQWGGSSLSITLTSKLTRYEATITKGSTASQYAYIYVGSLNEGQYVIIENPQCELKSYSTPYVEGTRSGIVRDMSGYKNDAQLDLATTPQWTNDSKIGLGCYKFDPLKNSNICIPNSKCKVTNQITVSAWAYRDNWQATTSERIISCTESGGWQLGFNDTAGYISFLLYISGVGYMSPCAKYKLSSIPVGAAWHHIAGVFDGVTAKLYLDGVLIDTQNSAGSTIGYNPTNGIFIGAEPEGSNTIPTGGQYWNGKMDDVQIYATALSSDDILELYQTRASVDNKGNFSINNIQEPYNHFNPVDFYYSVNSPSTQKPTYETVDGVETWDVYPSWFYPNGALLYKFKANTQYRVHIKFKHYTYYNTGYVLGGFVIKYTDGTSEEITCLGNSGWKTDDRVTAVNKTILGMWVYYYTNYRVYIDKNSYIREYIAPSLNEHGIASCNEFSELGVVDGLVAYYPMDGNANDYSGNKFHGTLVNSPVRTAGVKDTCYTFNGNSNYINIPHSAELEPSSVTVSVWIRMDANAPTTRNIFLTKWFGYSCEIEDTTRCPYFRLNGVGDVRSSENLVTGQWYHYVGTFENGVGAKIYLNGVLRGALATTTPITYSGSGVLNIGRYAGGIYFKGAIDDVRIYNRALSQEEIFILYGISSTQTAMKITEDTLYIKNEIKEVT